MLGSDSEVMYFPSFWFSFCRSAERRAQSVAPQSLYIFLPVCLVRSPAAQLDKEWRDVHTAQLQEKNVGRALLHARLCCIEMV